MADRYFFEFFAGGGMARAGLGKGWSCRFANDFDDVKAKAYTANWGKLHLKVADVADLRVTDLPEVVADLAWASFPCQDLSLAGNGEGIGDSAGMTRSGSFWSFWNLIQSLCQQNRKPSLIVLENVYGSLTANGGRDFASICRCLSLGGYNFGALLIDAEKFLPQSRPRIFIVAIRDDFEIPGELLSGEANAIWHPPAMTLAIQRLSEPDLEKWRWWNLPLPGIRKILLTDIVEQAPVGVAWHSEDETARLISLMSESHQERLLAMQRSGKHSVGTIYKRMRVNLEGKKVQRAELRWDGIAGCLRTPGGGSSRQTLLIVDGKDVKSRLLSPREAARLMGLPDSYKLPVRYNDAYHLTGDGLAVPVVKHLTLHLLNPLIDANALVFAVAAE
jgi:DNA (cytosine-5)-methyltransferase 1